MTETEIMAIAAGSMVLGGLIVKLTPTKVDDEWWTKLMRLLGRKPL
jgi:hypothetical protein